MKYTIEVFLKSNFTDHHGTHVQHDIAALGIKKVPKVRFHQLYRFEGELAGQEVETISEKLLIDPITDDYRIVSEAQNSKEHAIEVWLKQGVTDTVAESVSKAVKDLGIAKKLGIKTGQKYVFEGNIGRPQLKQVAEKMLVNPLIQNYFIG